MTRFAPLLALLLAFMAAPSLAQLVTVGGVQYYVDRIGGAEVPGTFNDPGDFNQPTYVTQAPGDNNTLYIVERTEASNINGETGRILRFDQETNTSSTYLDVAGTVVSDGGLLTMAFHPEFEQNGLFYVAANFDSGGGVRNRLLEYHDSGVGAPTLNRTLLEYSSLLNNFHTINWIGFQPGDDSHQLFVTTGDGGTQAAHPQFNPALIEDPDSPYGKILRVDLTADFSTPADDTTHTGVQTISLGHRNPYRASFDADGNLFFGEVGFNTVEELNFLSAAQIESPEIEDFGWTAREGTVANPVAAVGGPKGPNDIDPFFDYLQPDVNAAAVGYTGDTSLRGESVTPGYLFDGRYYFGDFRNGEVYSGAWDGASLTDVTDHTVDFEVALSDGIAWVVSFGTDNQGNLYIVDFGNNFFAAPGTGEIFRLSQIASPGDFNNDGLVDAADYTVWRDNQGASDERVLFHAGDGLAGVDEGDYQVWLANYGQSGASAAVPEPTAALLLAIAACGITKRRRRSV